MNPLVAAWRAGLCLPLNRHLGGDGRASCWWLPAVRGVDAELWGSTAPNASSRRAVRAPLYSGSTALRELVRYAPLLWYAIFGEHCFAAHSALVSALVSALFSALVSALVCWWLLAPAAVRAGVESA
jgi:hypothetical protein